MWRNFRRVTACRGRYSIYEPMDHFLKELAFSLTSKRKNEGANQ